jgi:NO-binding membrane sensor protein with MHYT domain
MSARRLLALGGIGLILVGMLVGDIFAVFVLHQNAARVGESLSAATHAAMAGDANAVGASFQSVGSFLENRGTKVDTHVHMIAFGYLALMLAILQPWVALRESTRKKVAWTFLIGAWLLPVGVFLIHYVGLAYSPLAAIGWASIFADLGGALVIVATLACLFGIARHFSQAQHPPIEDVLMNDRSMARRILLAGGLALILLGFLHGAYYAAVDLYRHEALDYSLLLQMTITAAAKNGAALDNALSEYGQLGGEKAVNIAAHAHAIEFGLLAMLLAFFQPFVSLRDSWKRNWAWVLLLGSLALPLFVLLELKLGLLAGGIADVGGLLVMIALLEMWIGILRYTGEIDAASQVSGGGPE